MIEIFWESVISDEFVTVLVGDFLGRLLSRSERIRIMAGFKVQRHALLIGVPEYDIPSADLPVVKEDVKILRKALESSRYSIQELGMKKTDMATRSRMRQRIRRFCAEANDDDTLLLYFTGHGINYKSRDYLIPSDGTLDDPTNLEEYLVPVDLSEIFDECKARTILFFVDACRSEFDLIHPSLSKGLFSEQWSKGKLGPVTDREYAIVFSCGPGHISQFREDGRFSFFTKALAGVLDAGHPAQKFRDVKKALQEHLNELTGEGARQEVRIRAEFDLEFRLMDREICDSPKMAKDEIESTETIKANEARQYINADDLLDRPEDFGSQTVHECVLFADLFGSTEFRLDHSEEKAIRKMVLHNKIASDIITENDGIVAKHVGDGVMGIFGGERCEKRAVSTGIAIIKRLEAENASRGLHFPDDLNTSIGIRSGRIYRLHYDTCNVEDYVGIPVDVASRLCSLAGLGQLVCDDRTFQRIQFPDPGWSYSDRVERFVEGLDEPLPVRLVVPGGYPCKADLIPLSGFTRPVPAAAKDRLKHARKFRREKRFDDAFKLYHEILNIDRGNFEANVCCAEIELVRVSSKETNRFKILDEVIHKYLCVAKQVRPQASRVWRLLGRSYYLQAIDTHDTILLSTALDRAMLALNCAQEHMDLNGEIHARTLLAEVLREQARLDETKSGESLAKANEHCGEVADQVVGFLNRTHSNHLAIQALIQADLGGDPGNVEKMLDQARTADPKNPRVHEALAEFYRIHGQPKT